MTVHVEACADVPEALRAIRATGARAGLSLNPPTPLARVQPFLGLVGVCALAALLLALARVPRLEPGQ